MNEKLERPISWKFDSVTDFVNGNYWWNPEDAIGDIRGFIYDQAIRDRAKKIESDLVIVPNPENPIRLIEKNGWGWKFTCDRAKGHGMAYWVSDTDLESIDAEMHKALDVELRHQAAIVVATKEMHPELVEDKDVTSAAHRVIYGRKEKK